MVVLFCYSEDQETETDRVGTPGPVMRTAMIRATDGIRSPEPDAVCDRRDQSGRGRSLTSPSRAGR